MPTFPAFVRIPAVDTAESTFSTCAAALIEIDRRSLPSGRRRRLAVDVWTRTVARPRVGGQLQSSAVLDRSDGSGALQSRRKYDITDALVGAKGVETGRVCLGMLLLGER